MASIVSATEVLPEVRRGLIHNPGPPAEAVASNDGARYEDIGRYEDSVRYEDVGPIDAPVVFVQGGITATRHVASNPADPTPGWWEPIVGRGRTIDPSCLRIISIDPLLSSDRCTSDGFSHDFSTHDQARAIVALLDQLRIPKIDLFVGASFGGMVGLAFAADYPNRLDRLVAISAPDRPHPIATAARGLQRRVLELGQRLGVEDEAVAIARGLAMTTYRTTEEFGERFCGEPDEHGFFPVEAYLRARGEALVGRLTAANYALLTRVLDNHCVDPRKVCAPTTIVAVHSDRLVPWPQLRRLATQIQGAVTLESIDSIYGHDAFLKETDEVGRILAQALTRVASAREGGAA